MSSIHAVGIKVNNFVDPVGINGDTPEISWQIAGGEAQSAWQIRAAATPEDWAKGKFIWDSGKVDDPVMAGHLYGGRVLCSREKVFFRVRLFDIDGKAGIWSDMASFETVLLNAEDWLGNWIGFPAGWSGYSDAMVNSNGVEVNRRQRELIYDVNTFRGRINIAMKYLKEHFPYSQIILLTILHRGNAEFSASNIQPAECYANACVFFADSYVEVIKEASNIWAVPVIDLNSLSGLYPMLDVHGSYFSNIHTDRLHPEISGHKRIAETLVYQLLSLPATFR